MAVRPALVYSDAPGSVPATYTLPPGFDVLLHSVSAQFNGSGAGGTFYPCLSVYSQDDKLIGRFFPAQALAAGDSAEVTFAPFLGPESDTAFLGMSEPFLGLLVFTASPPGGIILPQAGYSDPRTVFGTVSMAITVPLDANDPVGVNVVNQGASAHGYRAFLYVTDIAGSFMELVRGNADTTINSGDTDQLLIDTHGSGDVLMDLTDPYAPRVLATGVYSFTLFIVVKS